MMAWPTIVSGLLLVAVGVTGYATSELEKPPVTALIPAALGAILVVCGALAFNEKLRKHVMHLAAMVGLFGVVGGFMPLIRQIAGGGGFDPLKRSAIAGELTVVISAVFVGLCVNSFIQARKARQAREAAENAGQG